VRQAKGCFRALGGSTDLKESIRVYTLARELNVDPKDLTYLCRQLGVDVKNQLSVLNPEQRVKVEDVVRGGSLEIAKVFQTQHRSGISNLQCPPAAQGGPQSGVASVSRPSEGLAPVVLRPEPNYTPVQNPGIERLLGVAEKAGFEQLAKIATVAVLDPECAMFKIRKLTERLCRRLLKLNPMDNLNDAITELGNQRVLGKKATAYLHQVRTLSNVAVHVSDDLFDDEFSMQDVNNAAAALACVIDEALSRNLIQPKQ